MLAGIQSLVTDTQSWEGFESPFAQLSHWCPEHINELSRICLHASNDRELTFHFRNRTICLILNLISPYSFIHPLDHSELSYKMSRSHL